MKGDETDGACSMHEVDDKFVQNFNRQSEWKRPLERRRRKWQDNIKICIKVMEYEYEDWINLARDRI
jgi:hypothetical protein